MLSSYHIFIRLHNFSPLHMLYIRLRAERLHFSTVKHMNKQQRIFLEKEFFFLLLLLFLLQNFASFFVLLLRSSNNQNSDVEKWKGKRNFFPFSYLLCIAVVCTPTKNDENIKKLYRIKIASWEEKKICIKNDGPKPKRISAISAVLSVLVDCTVAVPFHFGATKKNRTLVVLLKWPIFPFISRWNRLFAFSLSVNRF